jgi:hypothetical protein
MEDASSLKQQEYWVNTRSKLTSVDSSLPPVKLKRVEILLLVLLQTAKSALTPQSARLVLPHMHSIQQRNASFVTSQAAELVFKKGTAPLACKISNKSHPVSVSAAQLQIAPLVSPLMFAKLVKLSMVLPSCPLPRVGNVWLAIRASQTWKDVRAVTKPTLAAFAQMDFNSLHQAEHVSALSVVFKTVRPADLMEIR